MNQKCVCGCDSVSTEQLHRYYYVHLQCAPASCFMLESWLPSWWQLSMAEVQEKSTNPSHKSATLTIKYDSEWKFYNVIFLESISEDNLMWLAWEKTWTCAPQPPFPRPQYLEECLFLYFKSTKWIRSSECSMNKGWVRRCTNIPNPINLEMTTQERRPCMGLSAKTVEC